MYPQLNTATMGAVIHYTEIDVRTCVERRIAAIARELAELGSDLDPERVFQVEALGYVVDPLTGYLSEVGHAW
jgi:hypothetical protein